MILADLPAWSDTPRPLDQWSLSELEAELKATEAELSILSHYSLRSGVGGIGYRSQAYSNVDALAWIEIFLGEEQVLDEIILLPTIWKDTKKGSVSDAFPEAFRIMAGAAGDPTGRIVAEYSPLNHFLPRIAPLIIPLDQISASWVRVESTQLGSRAYDGLLSLQLSEILVFSGQKNIALNQPVSTSDKIRDSTKAWSPHFIVDGFTPYLMNTAMGEQSIAYLLSAKKKTDPDLEITVDLEKPYPLSTIQLHSIEQSDTAPQSFAGDFGIPYQMLIEGANSPDFSDGQEIATLTRHSIYQTGPITSLHIPFTEVQYVRFTATYPYLFTSPAGTLPLLGFAEIELYAKDQNVALHKTVTTSIPSSDSSRRIEALTDGRNLYGNILPTKTWLHELARRHELETKHPLLRHELTLRYAQQKTKLQRMGWLAALLVAGLIFSGLIQRMIRMRQIAQLRIRFAADLHDELGANLQTIGLLSDLAENCNIESEELSMLHQKIRTVTERTATAMRHCSDMLESSGLYKGLIKDMQRASQRILANCTHELKIEGEQHLFGIKERSRVDLFLFYKECLVNISRHSGATHCTSLLEASPYNIQLTITDNGHGQEESQRGSVPESLTRRAQLLGAQVVASSPETGGTRIQLNLRTRKWRHRH